MKKTLVFVLVFVVVISGFSGCKGTNVDETTDASADVATETAETETKENEYKEEEILTTNIYKIVPNLIDMDVYDAIDLLEEKGYRVAAYTDKVSSYTAENCISSQSVKGNSVYPVGKEIELTVSTGMIIPSYEDSMVIGDYTGNDYKIAKKQLNKKSIEVEKKLVYDNQNAENTVLNQNIEKGKTLFAGERIVLTVSQGPYPVDMPYVENLSIEEAKANAEELGFTIRSLFQVAENVDEGTVLTQAVGEGSEIPKGSEVTVYIAFTDISRIAIGQTNDVIVVNKNGTVNVKDSLGNITNKYKVSDVTNAVSVAAGDEYVEILLKDGTMAKTFVYDSPNYNQSEVEYWSDVVQISAGDCHTVALFSNGTVRSTFVRAEGRILVGGWEDIIKVSAGPDHTVGLRSDGRVALCGDGYGYRVVETSKWRNIVDVEASLNYTMGLVNDGTVRIIGYALKTEYRNDWIDIVDLAAGLDYFAALDSNGDIYYAVRSRVGNKNIWNEGKLKGEHIVEIAGSPTRLVGLSEDDEIFELDLNPNNVR